MPAESASSQSVLVDQALAYLDDAWSCFPVCSPVPGHAGYCEQHGPCKNPGKLPLIKWGVYQDRVPTRLEVQNWWRKWPTANIGLATGRTSDVVVVDLDGELAVAASERYGYDPGPWVRTGRVGGRHLYFRFREDAPTIFAKTGGIDFRGQGGFVLLPPSLHYSGNRYAWGEPYQHGEPLPDLPHWVDELGATNEAGVERGPIDFGKLVSDGVPIGQRDQELFRAASKLRGADVPYQLAVDLIERAAAACAPPFDPGEARAKVDSAYSRYQPNAPAPTQLFGAGGKTELTVEPASIPDLWARPVSSLLEQGDTEPDWLVENLFSAGSSGFLAAEPKVGKSWIALDLAYCMCTASPFLDKFQVPQARRVLFIEEEDNERRVIRRLKQLIRGNPARGTPPDDMWRFAVRSGFRLDDTGWIDKLRQELDLQHPDVVFLDVFNKLHLKDENKQPEMAAILHDLAALTRTYGCAFIIVHHYRKSGIGQSTRGNQMLRGHSVLAGFAECSIFLRKEVGGKVVMEPESKDAPEIEPCDIRIIDTDNGGTRVVLSDQSADDISATAQKVLAWLQSQDSARTLYDMRLGCSLSISAIEKAKRSLQQDGLIVPDGKKERAICWKPRTDFAGIRWET